MIKLRDYQIECVDKILNMKDGDRGLVWISTGGGKSVILASVINKLVNENKRVMICMDQIEIRDQIINSLLSVNKDLEKEIGIVQGNSDQINIGKITICSRQTLAYDNFRRLDNLSRDYSHIFIDECHRGVSALNKIVNRLDDNIICCGFTATPYGETSKLFNKLVYKKDIESLIEDGYLVSPKSFKVRTDISLQDIKIIGGEFVLSQLDKRINVEPRNEIIVKSYIDYVQADNRKHCIVFCSSIDHCDSLVNTFKKYNIDARSIDSQDDAKERKKILNDFKSGKFAILCNVGICTTGFDYPPTDAILLARPTKSLTLFTQMVGRGLRISENKKDCLIIDISDSEINSLCTCENIFDLKQGEDFKERNKRKQIEQDKREEELKKEEMLRLEAERIRLEEIDLLNKSIYSVQEISNLDWFYNTINNYNISILSANPSIDFYIVQTDDTYISYKFTKLENYNTRLEELEKNDNLLELLEYVEKKAIQLGSSFINKHSKWKKEPITHAQERIVYKSKERIRTKWQCHKFISKRNSYFALKDIYF